MTRHKKHSIKIRSMYQWHRYIGVSIAFFILILSVSGILLNHTEYFGLNKKHIKSDWLLNHYGISAPKNIKSYLAGEHWISQWGKKIYLDDHAVADTDKELIGAVFYQDMLIIAQHDSLFLYTRDGELIEKMSKSEGVPPVIEAIGITDANQLAVRTVNGMFTSNQQLLHWQKSSSVNSIWSVQALLPDKLYQKTLELYRGKGLDLERVILDLHSGRLFGSWGIYFMDFVALLMIFLALSGVWIWTMRIIKKKKH